MVETIISDLGMVLLYFDNGIFFRKMARRISRPVEEIRKIVHDNIDLNILFEKNAVSPPDFYRNAVDLLGADVSYQDFYADYCDVFSLNPPVLDLYRRLAPRPRMILLSNTDIMRWTFIKSRFPEILIFDGYVLSFDVGFMKPQDEIYREALRTARSRPDSAVFIDDLQENVDGAIRLGMRGILFRSEADLAAELRELGMSV